MDNITSVRDNRPPDENDERIKKLKEIKLVDPTVEKKKDWYEPLPKRVKRERVLKRKMRKKKLSKEE